METEVKPMTSVEEKRTLLSIALVLFTSRETAWSCRTDDRKFKKIKKDLWILVCCSFIICLVLNFFANDDNF